MEPVKCFLIERTDRIKRYLRRYRHSLSTSASELDKCPLPGGHGYHNAELYLDEIVDNDPILRIQDVGPFRGDPRWPARCGCGYEFLAADERQIFTDRIYRRADNGEEMTLRDAPPGAIWDAEWLHGSAMWTGPDGKSLMCRLPNGHDWHIDGVASNCTRKDELGKHKCWVRVGVPPDLTVGKEGGETCAAGAGSILSHGPPEWHGYLRNGELTN